MRELISNRVTEAFVASYASAIKLSVRIEN